MCTEINNPTTPWGGDFGWARLRYLWKHLLLLLHLLSSHCTLSGFSKNVLEDNLWPCSFPVWKVYGTPTCLLGACIRNTKSDRCGGDVCKKKDSFVQWKQRLSLSPLECTEVSVKSLLLFLPVLSTNSYLSKYQLYFSKIHLPSNHGFFPPKAMTDMGMDLGEKESTTLLKTFAVSVMWAEKIPSVTITASWVGWTGVGA